LGTRNPGERSQSELRRASSQAREETGNEEGGEPRTENRRKQGTYDTANRARIVTLLTHAKNRPEEIKKKKKNRLGNLGEMVLEGGGGGRSRMEEGGGRSGRGIGGEGVAAGSRGGRGNGMWWGMKGGGGNKGR